MVTAVVIGGASGIGAAVVQRHREAGTRVVVWDVAEPADIRCDISDAAAVDEAAIETVERIGVPDMVTVTAGIGHSGMLLDVSPEDWDRVMATNTRGPWLAMRSLARVMVEAGAGGSFVATSSVSAHLVDPSMGAYCASKAALSMVVQVAAAEWAVHGIRVNAVGPGATHTPMLGRAPVDSGWLAGVARRTPMARLGQADDIAEAVLALHGLGWVTGQIVDCDGGLGLHSPINPTGVGGPV